MRKLFIFIVIIIACCTWYASYSTLFHFDHYFSSEVPNVIIDLFLLNVYVSFSIPRRIKYNRVFTKKNKIYKLSWCSCYTRARNAKLKQIKKKVEENQSTIESLLTKMYIGAMAPEGTKSNETK